MASVEPLRKRAQPIPLHDHALDHLRYIRETMERSGSFTAVPGWGGVAMGITALVAAWIAALQPTPRTWLNVWIFEGMLAAAIGAIAVLKKSRTVQTEFLTAPARKFLLSFTPALLAGALITMFAYREGSYVILPGVWMTCYGSSVLSGGTFSVRVIPLMGASFMFIGGLALLMPQ